MMMNYFWYFSFAVFKLIILLQLNRPNKNLHSGHSLALSLLQLNKTMREWVHGSVAYYDKTAAAPPTKHHHTKTTQHQKLAKMWTNGLQHQIMGFALFTKQII